MRLLILITKPLCLLFGYRHLLGWRSIDFDDLSLVIGRVIEHVDSARYNIPQRIFVDL
jgi:hypothetical protein